jgi:hypothetical protein
MRKRPVSRRRSWRRRPRPSCCQARKECYAVGHGGRSGGHRRQAAPARSPHGRAALMWRLGYFRGRPPGFSRGSTGASIGHSSSVKSRA